MATPDERAPLLEACHNNNNNNNTSVPTRSLVHRICYPTVAQRASVTIFLGIFMLELATNASMPALNSIIETLVCREIYAYGGGGGSSGTADPRCKAPDVVARFTSVRSTMTALDCIPAIVLALPYGILADHVGRRPVVIMAWAGYALQMAWYLVALGGTRLGLLPLWSVYVASAWTCIGAFASVGMAMVYTILGDVTPLAERATAYFYVTSFFLVAELISNPLGGALLLWCGDYLALACGVAGALLGTAVICTIPETLDFQRRIVQPVVVSSDTAVAKTRRQTRRQQIADAWAQLVHLLRTEVCTTAVLILGNRALLLLMAPLCLVTLGRFVQDLLLQYATKRYHWSWSQASFLLTIRSTVNLLLCLVVLPAVSELLVRRCRRVRVHPLVKDLWLARVSAALLCLGALLIAFAVTPAVMSAALVVFSLGGGFAPVMRSLVNAYVEPHHQAMLQTLLGLLELSGLLVAAPVMYSALQRGQAWGGLWTGLPFLVAAAMIFVGLLIISVFRLPADKLRADDAEATESAEAEV